MPIEVENPYNYNLPVAEEALFVGRHEQVGRMVRHLLASKGDSYGLVGGRRMGKTSLLRQLAQQIRARQTDETSLLLPLPLTFDFTGDVVSSATDFFALVAARMQAALEELPATVPAPTTTGWLGRMRRRFRRVPPIQLDPHAAPGPALMGVLAQGAEWVMSHFGREFRLILLLDECERLVAQPWADVLQATLRYVLVDEQGSRWCKVVMAGSHGFRTQTLVKGSPLENVLKYEFLYNFGVEPVRALAAVPQGQGVEVAVVEALYTASGGHPFLTQYLLHGLWEQGWSTATAAMIPPLSRRFSQERHDFADWLNHLGGEPAGRAYQQLLDHAPVTEEAWRKQMNGVDDFSFLVNGFLYHGLARRDEATYVYTPAGRMFADWFAQQGDGLRSLAPAPPRWDMATIHAAMSEGLSFEECRKVLFMVGEGLGVGEAQIPQGTQAEWVTALLAHCQRRGNVAVLVAHLQGVYPHLGL
jgi:hypothetical protein